MRKVAVIGTVGIPACYGGFESLVENITRNRSEELDYIVFCSAKDYPEKLDTHNGANLIYLPLKANGVQSIFYDILSLMKCWLLKPDVVLILGVSGCLFLPVFRLLSRSKVVTNIDGLEWKREKWGKWAKRFLKISEACAVKYSDVVVTDNQAITEYVMAEYSVKSTTIAYGGDHALLKSDSISPSESLYALGLCRIEPENNVEMILEAFANTDHHIKFVGNWDSSDFGVKLKAKYSLFENIDLIDPIYDIEKLYTLRSNCSIYIHGHSAGGTNPSLVEMMHFGLPIFAFDCNFNRFSTENKANYFKGINDLITLINDDKVDLEFNGREMKDIASRRYTWYEVSRAYESLY